MENILLYHSRSKPWTYEETAVFFKKFNREERKLNALALSYSPFRDLFAKDLLSRLDEHYEITDDLENYLSSIHKKENLRLLLDGIRLCNAARYWIAHIVKMWANPNQLDEEFFEHKNSKVYLAWCEKITKQFKNVAAMRDHFISENQGLVGQLAGKIRSAANMPYEDLFQEGNIGLMVGINKFDYNKGFAFSTYGNWWIRHAMSRAIADKRNMIRIPVHILDKYVSIRRLRREHQTKYGTEPSSEWLQEQSGVNEKSLKAILALDALQATSSMDAPLATDGDTDWYSVVPDEKSLTPEEMVESSQLNLKLRKCLNSLPERERIIIEHRIGLVQNRSQQDGRTLNEIGQEWGLSRERIRQLEAVALQKMRRSLQAAI